MLRLCHRQSTSIAQHHAEWLSLLDISGPFLSLPVLLQGVPAGAGGRRPRPEAASSAPSMRSGSTTRAAIAPTRRSTAPGSSGCCATCWRCRTTSCAWIRRRCDRLAVPVAEQGETLRPDMAVVEPRRQPGPGAPAGPDLPRARGWRARRPTATGRRRPATRMMELLHATGVRLGLVTNGEQWMLVDAPAGRDDRLHLLVRRPVAR